MEYTDSQIERALLNISKIHKSPIIRTCKEEYIIIAQNELDYRSKKNKILNGSTFGFYTIQQALELDVNQLTP